MKKVLFLCTGNSARSQMAEGLVNSLYKDRMKAYSAGIEPTLINPHTIEAMTEIDIDISKQTVNKPEDFMDIDFDYLITLCDHANESCPLFLTEKSLTRLHWGFPDPAGFIGSEEEILNGFRKVRDDIRKQIIEYFT